MIDNDTEYFDNEFFFYIISYPAKNIPNDSLPKAKHKNFDVRKRPLPVYEIDQVKKKSREKLNALPFYVTERMLGEIDQGQGINDGLLLCSLA